MTDSNAFKEAVANCGVKLSAVCEAAGMTYATLRGKIRNEHEFTASEIYAISSLLHLTSEQRDHIFFAS